MCVSTSTPASEVSRPPSKAARAGLPAIGDEKALRSGCSITRSTAVRDRLHPSGQARTIGGTGGLDIGLGCAGYTQKSFVVSVLSTASWVLHPAARKPVPPRPAPLAGARAAAPGPAVVSGM